MTVGWYGKCNHCKYALSLSDKFLLIGTRTKGPGIFWLGGPFGPYLGQFGSVLKTLSSSEHKLAMQKTYVKKEQHQESGTRHPMIHWDPPDDSLETIILF
jgi:hypothetical protein